MDGDLTAKKYKSVANSGVLYAIAISNYFRVGYQSTDAPGCIIETTDGSGPWDQGTFTSILLPKFENVYRFVASYGLKLTISKTSGKSAVVPRRNLM